MLYIRSTFLDRLVLVAAAFGIIGIAMVIAGIMNLRAALDEEDEPVNNRSKKKAVKRKERSTFTNWLLGGSSNMPLKKQGSLRIKIGIVLIVCGLVVAGTFLFG